MGQRPSRGHGPGGRYVSRKLNELREAIREYRGGVNGLRVGVKPEKPLVKPEALVLYEGLIAMRVPLVAGAFMDQPHLWLMEYEVCREESMIFDRLESNQDEQRRLNETAQQLKAK